MFLKSERISYGTIGTSLFSVKGISDAANLFKGWLLLDILSNITDAEVLLEFSTLLSYLEMQFTFIILISHIEMSRDMTQSLIEISKKNGFSKVHFE